MKSTFFQRPFFIMFFSLSLSCVWAQDVKFEPDSVSGGAFDLLVHVNVVNTTRDSILMIRPRPVREYNNFVPGIVEPEFYSVNIVPEQSCLFASYNAATSDTKTPSDFFILAPKSKYPITLRLGDFQQCISQTDGKKVTLQVNYRFNDKLLNPEVFDREISKRGNLSSAQRDELFKLLQRVYRKPIAAAFKVKPPQQ